MSFINNIRPDFNGGPFVYKAYTDAQWVIKIAMKNTKLDLVMSHNKQIAYILQRHREFAKIYDNQVLDMEAEIRRLRSAVEAKEVENKRLRNIINNRDK